MGNLRSTLIDDMMRKFGALDGAIENVGSFDDVWCNGKIGNP